MAELKENVFTTYDHVGGPFYALNLEVIKKNVKSFMSSFLSVYPKVQFGYSYKTNYTKDIIRTVTELGAYSEIVSNLEYEITQSLEIPHHRIIYNGPFKDFNTMTNVLIGGGIVHLDSLAELTMLDKIIDQTKTDKIMRLGIRCNILPDKLESRFGVDVNSQEMKLILDYINKHPNYSLDALHIHYADRDLKLFELRTRVFFEYIAENFNPLPPIINLGSGFYSEMDQETFDLMNGKGEMVRFLDYADVLSKLLPIIDPNNIHPFTIFFEPGTPLVVNSMELIGKVQSIKTLGKKNIATTNLSIFDFNPRNFPKKNPIKIYHFTQSLPLNSVLFVGNTCVEKDVIYEDYSGPLSLEDIIVIRNVGSYSNVMKPPFIFESLPIIIVDENYEYIQESKSKLDSNKIITDYR